MKAGVVNNFITVFPININWKIKQKKFAKVANNVPLIYCNNNRIYCT